MARHLHIWPLHEGKRAEADEIAQRLEAHLGTTSVRTEQGHRFEFRDEDPEPTDGELSEALDVVAPDWRNHVEMGL